MKITDSAREKLQTILGENPGKKLRLVFEGFGWGGPKLGLALDEPNDKEKSVILGGLEILIAEEVAPYTAEQVVDYVDSRLGKGFVIRRASGAAGCW